MDQTYGHSRYWYEKRITRAARAIVIAHRIFWAILLLAGFMLAAYFDHQALMAGWIN